MKFDCTLGFNLLEELEAKVKRIFPDATNCSAVLGTSGISIIASKDIDTLGDFFYSYKTGKVTIQYHHTHS